MIFVFMWPLTAMAIVFDHGIKPRGHKGHLSEVPSQSIVTVTVDWLPPHGPGTTESSAPPGYGSSTVDEETKPGVVLVHQPSMGKLAMFLMHRVGW